MHGICVDFDTALPRLTEAYHNGALVPLSEQG